jgi:hypothetical protein
LEATGGKQLIIYKGNTSIINESLRGKLAVSREWTDILKVIMVDILFVQE